jgi:hypothetical protein
MQVVKPSVLAVSLPAGNTLMHERRQFTTEHSDVSGQ